MLVLTRKVGEMVRIGDIEIKVVRLTGNRVRIGIDAPRGVHVVRGELQTRTDIDNE
jgi:carbon storage regulator